MAMLTQDYETQSRGSGVLDFSKPHSMIPAGSSELAYWRVGQGPDLVLLHGWPLHSATYRELVPLLCNEFTCHLFDFPGVGLSKTDPKVLCNLEYYALAVHRALEALNLQAYGLVAHDSGGVAAALLASLAPQKVQGLVIAGSETLGSYSLLLRMLLLVAKAPGGLFLFAKLLQFKAFRESIFGFGGALHDNSKINGEFFQLFGQPLIRDQAVVRGHNRLAQTIRFPRLNELKALYRELPVPVQLIWGAQDKFFPVEKARGMLEFLPSGSELKVIDQARTFVHEDNPVEFARLVKNYMQPAIKQWPLAS